jgi:hypothetical protein
MQKRKLGNSDLEVSALRGIGANSVSRKRRKFFIALWLIAAAFITSASGQDTKKSKPEPLVIQEQGSGGNVTLVHLPEIGVRGSTHFPMSDMNNLEIAVLMSKFLKEKGLD